MFSTDNQQIAVLAADHLLERNLRNFAYCGVTQRTIDPWNRLRQESFTARLASAGYACSVYKGRQSASHSWERLQEKLAAWLSRLPKSVGQMEANDIRARDVLEACRRIELNAERQPLNRPIASCQICNQIVVSCNTVSTRGFKYLRKQPLQLSSIRIREA